MHVFGACFTLTGIDFCFMSQIIPMTPTQTITLTTPFVPEGTSSNHPTEAQMVVMIRK